MHMRATNEEHSIHQDECDLDAIKFFFKSLRAASKFQRLALFKATLNSVDERYIFYDVKMFD